MRHYVFDESDVINFKYCPHCGKELFSVYQGDYAGYLECSECDGCEGFYILEEMIFREPKWLINVIKAYISEMNNYKHAQNKRYREYLELIRITGTHGKDISTGEIIRSDEANLADEALEGESDE